MDDTSHTAVLKRVGTALTVIGLIDIAIMLYCLANAIAYSSSLNIFAVIGGLSLRRGSLRAASLIRSISVFGVCFMGAIILALPLMYPLDLMLAQLRGNMTAALTSILMFVAVGALLGWLARELGSAPIMQARAGAGRKQRDMRIPATLGLVLAVMTCVGTAMLMAGETAQKAVEMARKRLGDGYRYKTTSINIRSGSNGTFVHGTVTAWNEREVHLLPIQWEEKP